MKKKLVIVGNGMVGHRCCELLVKRNAVEQFSITVLCEEEQTAYDRVHLSEFYDGKKAEDLSLCEPGWYEEHGIEILTSTGGQTLDREFRTITDTSGRVHSFDKLIFATGSSAFVPPIDGVAKDGVFVYRTINDLEQIKAYAQDVKTATVMGGGLLGLEAAKAMVDLGLETNVIEFAPQLMPRQLDGTGARLLKSKIEDFGIDVLLNKSTQSINGNGRMTSLSFSDSEDLVTDMLVISAGIRPRDELAKKAGLACHERGGILVDQYMQTSDPDILAIGECACRDMIYGLVAPGYRMAETAVATLHGAFQPFLGADMSTKLKLIGVDVCNFGNISEEQDNAEVVVTLDSINGIYKKLVIDTNSRVLLGGILVGDAEDYNMLHQMMLNKVEVPENLLGLLAPSGGDAPEMELPEEALVCSCNSVSKKEICSAIDSKNLTAAGQIKACTQAGAGCGGCIPLVTQILNQRLEQKGVQVKKHVCEHFDYTRQELFVFVKKENIKSFAELVNKHGRGQGCEICKPAVASILASSHNAPILENYNLQDTNDAFLANIQKNGSYSVIPRIPGGEITPDKLIAIGQVARKYNLYTKITGGQRIDLFGARKEDLPEIWGELIEAGFESGHAYAKALRTIKSCVGSTWCRYGVQDAVGLAIELENRYKGLRAPHKIKSAVSGCTRECAEAQSKDFGVIATEAGWNLYVCGNGGMKPQHASLLASGLDKATLISYIDRFLMYYVRTADRLSRTSTWFNTLDGGIEHLRQVIIEDSLGIAAELEADMQGIVDTFHCEWKDAISDPEKLKRFRSFINTDEQDPSIEFVDERGQIKPLDLVQLKTENTGVLV